MGSTILVILVGVALVAVLVAVVAFLGRGNEVEGGKFSAGYPMLTLGIVLGSLPGLGFGVLQKRGEQV